MREKITHAFMRAWGLLYAFYSIVQARYLDNLRWREFGAAVTVAFVTMQGLGVRMGLPPEKAAIVGYVAACIGAAMYFRNPKKLDWQTDASDTTTEAATDTKTTGDA